ncbi:LysM peptidoglycan-binding domain-containing protein [Acidovorax sp. PRC11]|uniref:LysM peptidoglycan-binding domain-containing protein n=1 Tax=Acidovorax sp. PRC11 TaxID=2962592 RepID=UPI002880D76C|nr:LysM peptidoglycan-binding domain-containing protein [Acidovorax sp. PRC11]MDT0140813.1 LysM peptidoglycan-binding domain-containing protein [Acidovorax sp. PRC11]
MQRQLVANGEVLARYGDAPTSEENPTQTNNPVYVDTADFRLQAAQIRPRHKSMDPIAYTVVGGETLKDIARNVLGDASLWWRIAEANSLAVSGDGALTAGQTLTVPKLSLNANSVETFQPYDPSQAMGSMDPVLPVPANGGGCGGIGQIIMIVVAVVAAYFTAGAAAGLLGSAFQAVGAGVTIGTTTLSATGAFIASAIGGAVGSIASQAVGIAIGAQEGFSWKGVALSALGGGIASGLAGTQLLGGSQFGVSVARAAVGNVLSQGIAVVTGLQDRFDWKGVVASAAGAGVGWGMNQALGLTDANGMSTNMPDGVEKFARAGLSGFAAGTTAAVMRGGRISVQQVATDAFGNALGSSVADMMTPRDSIYSLSPKGMRGLGIQAPAEWGTPSWTGYDQFLNAFRNPSEADRSQDVQLAAGPGYMGGTGTSGRDSLSLSDNRGLESANSKILSTLQAQGLGLKQNIDLLNAASAEAAALKEAEAAASAGNPRSMPPDRWIPDSSGNGGTTVGSRDDWQTNNAGNGFNVPRYDSMKSIDGLDAWFTFNSAGRAAAGVGAFALNAFTAIPGLVRGAWRLGQDAYGYASYALAPQRSLLTGQAFAYQPKSALMQSIEQQGVLGTVGAGITGTVRNAPGIGVIGALVQPHRDWRDVGEQLANTGMVAISGSIGRSSFGNVRGVPPLPGQANFIGPMKPSNWDALIAHPDGHAFSVHGGGVTDADLIVRARTGVKPDGSTGPIPPLSSAFHSDTLLVSADQSIRSGGGLANAIARQPGQSVVRVEAQDVGNLGMDLGYGYVRLGSTGNKAANASALGPIQRVNSLNSAQGIYELNPLTGVWETITVYPAPY